MEELNSINFAHFFGDGYKKDVLIIVKNEDLELAFKKITEKFIFVLAAGGLVKNEKGEFLTRAEAWQEAKRCNQFLDSYIEEHIDDIVPPSILYSEDIW